VTGGQLPAHSHPVQWQALAPLSKIPLVSIYQANPDDRSREHSFTGSGAGVGADILFFVHEKPAVLE